MLSGRADERRAVRTKRYDLPPLLMGDAWEMNGRCMGNTTCTASSMMFDDILQLALDHSDLLFLPWRRPSVLAVSAVNL